MPYNKKHTIISMVIKTIAILVSIYGMTADKGEMMFTYFTNLSNLWVDIILFVFLILDAVLLVSKGKKNGKKNWLYLIKYVLTTSVMLTFLVYLLLLAPLMPGGILRAYLSNQGGSLCLHFITPLLAIIDFILFDYGYQSKPVHALYASVPPLLYAVFVIIAGQAGVRWFGTMMAPYNFLNYGAPTGWFGFDLSQMGLESMGIGVFYMIILVFFIFVGVGRLFLLASSHRRKAMIKSC